MSIKITYSVERKKTAIIKLKKRYTRLKQALYLGLAAFSALLVKILINGDHFKLSDTGSLFSNVRSGDITIITLCIIDLLLVLYLAEIYASVKKKYDKLRLEMIMDLDSNDSVSRFCFCHGECNCRDIFVKEMEAYGIDLAIKTKIS